MGVVAVNGFRRVAWTYQVTARLTGFLAEQGQFQIDVEATACYERLVQLVEPIFSPRRGGILSAEVSQEVSCASRPENVA